MAPGSRIIAQLIVNGLTVLSRAFITAYNEALKNARHGGAAGAANAAVRSLKRQMPPDEASKILNIERSSMTAKEIAEAYERMFTNNDPAKGGSFYLQSKIYRAREILEAELREIAKGKSSSNTQTKQSP